MRSILIIPLLLLPLPAGAFTAQNGMQAHLISPTEIEVPYEGLHQETDYWCAAGDFAEQVMGKPGTTRMWRASAKPRKAGAGIVFTLNAAQKAEGAGLSSFGSGTDDGSMSVGMAVGSYCVMDFQFRQD